MPINKYLFKVEKYNSDKFELLMNSAITAANNNQMAKKRALNSCYGALGNQYFRYCNRDIAEGIQPNISGLENSKTIEKTKKNLKNL